MMTISALLFGLVIVGLGAGWFVHTGKLGEANRELNYALQVSQKENADLREKMTTLTDDHAIRINNLNNSLEDIKDVVSECDNAPLNWPEH